MIPSAVSTTSGNDGCGGAISSSPSKTKRKYTKSGNYSEEDWSKLFASLKRLLKQAYDGEGTAIATLSRGIGNRDNPRVECPLIDALFVASEELAQSKHTWNDLWTKGAGRFWDVKGNKCHIELEFLLVLISPEAIAAMDSGELEQLYKNFSVVKTFKEDWVKERLDPEHQFEELFKSPGFVNSDSSIADRHYLLLLTRVAQAMRMTCTTRAEIDDHLLASCKGLLTVLDERRVKRQRKRPKQKKTRMNHSSDSKGSDANTHANSNEMIVSTATVLAATGNGTSDPHNADGGLTNSANGASHIMTPSSTASAGTAAENISTSQLKQEEGGPQHIADSCFSILSALLYVNENTIFEALCNFTLAFSAAGSDGSKTSLLERMGWQTVSHALVNLIKTFRGRLDVQIGACRALGVLMFADESSPSPTQKNVSDFIVGELSGMELVADLMKHNPGNEEAQKTGCLVLNDMLSSGTNQKRWQEAGQADVVVNALKAYGGVAQIQCSGLRILRYSGLSANGIIDTGVHMLAGAAMMSHRDDKDVQQHAKYFFKTVAQATP